MRYIKLSLKAPLMSFGDSSSQYQNARDTANRPTKSMIVGLIACSFGIERGDKRIELLAHELTALTTTMNKKASLWQDYQNAHIRTIDKRGYYGSKDDKNIQRWKTYISNGHYIIFVGCENEELLHSIYKNLQRPFWPLFAGRKCCPFSESLVEKEFLTYEPNELDSVVSDFNEKMEDNVQLCICL